MADLDDLETTEHLDTGTEGCKALGHRDRGKQKSTSAGEGIEEANHFSRRRSSIGEDMRESERETYA
jgi:hypothetical protein